MEQLIILCAILVILSILSYSINRTFLSISFLTSVLFGIVTILSISSYNYTRINIGIKTILIILLAIIFMIIGEMFSKIRIRPKETGNILRKKIITTKKLYEISNIWIIVSCALGIITYFARMKTLNDFSSLYMIDGSIDSLRMYFTSGAIQTDRLVVWMTYACQTMSFIFIYFFLYNLIYGNKKDFKLLLPILAYFFVEYSTTGRTGYIKFFCFMFVIAAVFYNNKYKKNIYSIKKIIKVGICSAALIMIFFMIYGVFVRKTDSSFLETINGYLNGGFYGLDYYLYTPWEKNDYFGQHIFYNLYSTANSFGFAFNIGKYHLPFYINGNISSNIYTGFVFPIHDFGILLFLLSRAFLGFVYSKLIDYLKKLSQSQIFENIFFIIIIADLWYPILNVVIADRYIDYLDLSYIIILLFYYCFIKLFQKKIMIK